VTAVTIKTGKSCPDRAERLSGLSPAVRVGQGSDKGIGMTGTIAGVYSTWARIATDSYLSTAEGDGSNGMKPFVLSHLAAVIAGRGNDELFWIIAMEATKFDIRSTISPGSCLTSSST
jgi:hypothetical protein